MNHKKMLYWGIAIFLISAVVGLVGTAWEIHGSFNALETLEGSDIGIVGEGIRNALVSTSVGLVGSVVGLALIIASVIKARRH